MRHERVWYLRWKCTTKVPSSRKGLFLQLWVTSGLSSAAESHLTPGHILPGMPVSSNKSQKGCKGLTLTNTDAPELPRGLAKPLWGLNRGLSSPFPSPVSLSSPSFYMRWSLSISFWKRHFTAVADWKWEASNWRRRVSNLGRWTPSLRLLTIYYPAL